MEVFDFVKGTQDRSQHLRRQEHHKPMFKMRRQCPDDYFKWAFVRHPADRLVSSYYSMLTYYGASLVDGSHPKCESFTKFVQSIKASRIKKFDFGWAIKNSPAPSHPHNINPMVYYVCDWDTGEVLVDFIGKFESLQEDWRTVCTRLHLNAVPVPMRNTSNHAHWTELYTVETLDIVRNLYADDFCMFGYDIEMTG